MTLDPKHAEHIALHHGMPAREILAASDTELGLVFTHQDGSAYVDVPADRPDFEGKTGLMFLVPPIPVSDPHGRGYTGSFPVYAHVPPQDGDTAPDGEPVADGATVAPDPLDGLTKPELLAYATERKLELDPKGKTLEVIRGELAAAIVAAATQVPS